MRYSRPRRYLAAEEAARYRFQGVRACLKADIAYGERDADTQYEN
jgi:hypothetical protein